MARSAIVVSVTNYEERLIKSQTDAVNAATIAINGLRYAVAAGGNRNDAVTRCDLNAAEARITAAIVGQQGSEDLAPLSALVTRAENISSKLKVLSGKLTQLDSSTDNQTAP